MTPEDRALLVRIDERTRAINARLDFCFDNHEERIDDHEKRVRALESWQNRVIGKLAGISAAVGAFVAWLTSVFTAGSGGG